MTKQDRTTLKSFFSDGALPTAKEYQDLIDSSVNQVEDGFAKSPSDGLQLNSIGSSFRVLSLYKGLGAPRPSWVIDHSKTEGDLLINPVSQDSDAPGQAALSLTGDGRAGVGVVAPEWRLDVNGVARMAGRIGVNLAEKTEVPADGDWHDITGDMTGCQAFEVMAGAGGDVTGGRYSMLHAVAMNAFNPRNRILNWLFRRRSIRAQTAVYGSYADRIKLRWVAGDEPHFFHLELRTNAHFGKDKMVRFYLTRLWFDTKMTGSRGGPVRDEDAL